MQKLFVLCLIALFVNVSAASAQSTKDSTNKPWFKLADSTEFVGKYLVQGHEFDHVKVVVKDTSLYFFAGSYEGPLEAMTARDSFLAMGQVIVIFYRDNNKAVEGFRADTNGSIMDAKKEKLPK